MSIEAKIAEHPYITGGAIIGIGLLFLLLHSSGSNTGTSGEVSGVATGPDDNVQIAQLQAATALQQQQGAAVAAQNNAQAQLDLAGLQLSAQNYTTQQSAVVALAQNATAGQANELSAQVSEAGIVSQTAIAQYGFQTQSDINQQNQVTQQLQISTQGQVANAQTAAALQAQQAADAASVSINGQNAALQLGIVSSNNAVTVNGQNRGADIAYTQLTTQAATDQAAINAQQQIAVTGLNDQTSVLNNQSALASSVVSGINSGVYNKGGQGGADQVSIIGALFGAPNLGNAAQADNASSNSTLSSIFSSLSSFGQAVVNTPYKIFS